MLREDTSTRLIVVGFSMLLAGWFALLLIVIGRVGSGFLLDFGAYAVSVAGLAIGLFGVGEYTRRRGA